MKLNIIYSVVTNEPLEFQEITGWSSRLRENYRTFERNPWNITKFHKEKPKDHNM